MAIVINVSSSSNTIPPLTTNVQAMLGTVGAGHNGGFAGNKIGSAMYSGTQYFGAETWPSTTGFDPGFIAGGGNDSDDELIYDIVNHVLSGDLDEVSLGFGLQVGSGAGAEASFSNRGFTISGLGLSGSGPANAVHSVVWGLMSGNAAPLEAILDANDLTINGAGSQVTLWGYAGNDTIYGGSGREWIYGNGGNDHLYGGGGNDTFGFKATGFGNDTIYDFNAGDKLEFSKSGFASLGINTAADVLTYYSGNTINFGGSNGSIVLNNSYALSASDIVLVA